MTKWEKFWEKKRNEVHPGEKEYFYFLSVEEMVYYTEDEDYAYFDSMFCQPEYWGIPHVRFWNIRRFLAKRPLQFSRWDLNRARYEEYHGISEEELRRWKDGENEIEEALRNL